MLSNNPKIISATWEHTLLRPSNYFGNARRYLCFGFSGWNPGEMAYNAQAMFSICSKLRKTLAFTAPLGMLWVFMSCVAVCGHHLEETGPVDAHGASLLQADENCPVMSLTPVVTAGRFSFSSDGESQASFATPICLAEMEQHRSARWSIFRSSLSPPCMRLRILRI